MVETISPVGYGARTGRWLAAVALHAFGATVTAAVFGAALGAAGALLDAPFGATGLIVVATLALAYAAREAVGLSLPVPTARRQVPDWWRSFFAWPVAATLYGAGLGIGFLTYLANGGLVVVAGAAVASGAPITGAVLLGAFGLARGLSPLVAWPVRTREAGTALVDRLAASDPRRWSLANAAVLVLVAAAATAAVPSAAAANGTPAGSAAAAVVALAFGWSATAKLMGRQRWARTVSRFALPAEAERLARVGVPAVELAVPVAVALGFVPAAGALALALLLGFSAVIVRERLQGIRAIACGCFGGAASRDYRVALIRNAVLGLAALAATRVPARGPAQGPAQGPDIWPGVPDAAELLPLALAAAALVVGALTMWRTAVWLGRAKA